jgi:hypothetical protein
MPKINWNENERNKEIPKIIEIARMEIFEIASKY